MTKYFCFIFILAAGIAGCKKTGYLLYNDAARIQLADTTAMSYTFIYREPDITRDTIYIEVRTMGGITPLDRIVQLEQVPEYDKTYVRDPLTNQIIDSTVTEKPFKAIPGTHYIPFDDKTMASVMVVKAGSPTAMIPVVLLRDTSLKSNSRRLRVTLIPSDAFAIGETKAIEKTIIFSDRLERFFSWRVDNSSAPAFITFGKYSVGKHQFIYDVLKVKIDEEWYRAITLAQAQQHYKNMLRDALAAFNADPENMASGNSPLRETSDPASPAVTFPQ